MRVVAGTAGGRLLAAPAGRSTRPTSDRVREAMFSMLTSMDLVEGMSVLDLFAGSGALGIEALSRGSGPVTFVDSDPSAMRAVMANLTVVADRSHDAHLVASDAWIFLRREGSWDMVLADPPYSFDRWTELFAALVGKAGTVVAETGAPLEVGPAWETVKVKRYSGTVVTVARPAAHAPGQLRQEGEI